MLSERCENCRWWHERDTMLRTYECRRHPPTAVGDFRRYAWPETDNLDWCGEFSQRAAEEAGSDG